MVTAMPSFTPTVVTLDALILREREWKRLTASQGSSPEAPPPTGAERSDLPAQHILRYR